jgi:hypothetical protein
MDTVIKGEISQISDQLLKDLERTFCTVEYVMYKEGDTLAEMARRSGNAEVVKWIHSRVRRPQSR